MSPDLFCVYRVVGVRSAETAATTGAGAFDRDRPGPAPSPRREGVFVRLPSRRAADEYGRGDDGVARGRRDRGSAVRVDVRHEGRGGRGARRLGADRGWRGGRRNARRGVASPRVARARVARGEDREQDRERRRADETALRPPDRAHPAEGNPPPGAGGVEVHSARSSREPTRVASGTSVERAPFYPKPRTPDEMQVCWTPRPAGREKIQRVSLVSSDNSGGFATGKQSEKNTPESMMVIGRDADPRLQTCPIASNPLKRATFPVAVTHTTPRRRRAERRESAREAPLVATRRLARLGGASPLVPLAGFRS